MGFPRSRVRARGTLGSAPHRNLKNCPQGAERGPPISPPLESYYFCDLGARAAWYEGVITAVVSCQMNC